jgi:hypothetical protein
VDQRTYGIMLEAMEEITFQVQRDEQSGLLTAWWDDSSGSGGITTQGQDLRDLQQHIPEAVGVHFDDGAAPSRIRGPLRQRSYPGSGVKTAPGYLGNGCSESA